MDRLRNAGTSAAHLQLHHSSSKYRGSGSGGNAANQQGRGAFGVKGTASSGGGALSGTVLDSASVKNMIHLMSGYAMGQLLDGGGRQELRERVADRLKEKQRGVNVQYPEQAVLANLDWGIDGLDKALKATNPEARAARLENTEKMLQVAVLLEPKRKTAGVPNSYLAAWANLYMALVWKLRNDDRNVALHLLDMFLMDPPRARRDFAPALWEQLFRPHMANIEAWYRTELDLILTTTSSSSPLNDSGGANDGGSGVESIIPVPRPNRSRTNSQDSSNTHWRSFSKPQDKVGDDAPSTSSSAAVRTEEPRSEGVVVEPPPQQKLEGGRGGAESSEVTSLPALDLTPDQIMRKELLHKLYQDSLDENTLEYAHYYKDWMAFDAAENPTQDHGDAGAYTRSEQSSPTFPTTLVPAYTSSRRLGKTVEHAGGSSGRAFVSPTSAAGGGNGTFAPAGEGVQALQKRVAQLRQSPVEGDRDRDRDRDRDHDSFADAFFKDAPAYSRDSSIDESSLFQKAGEATLGDVIERGNEGDDEEDEDGTNSSTDHQNFDAKSGIEDDDDEGEDGQEGTANGDDEEDETSVQLEKGAGVYLDEEELTEDELLQVWEEIAEGRIGLHEANDFIDRLSDDEGRALDFLKLSSIADALKAHRREHLEEQQKQGGVDEDHSSPESESRGSKHSGSPQSDVEEEEEAEVKIRLEFDRPDSPDTLSRMNSQSSRSTHSIRKTIFQQSLYSRGASAKIRPPKDFVCSITNQLFRDPVTLETGQTYERKAIKEWLDRGNTTCPITRQPLKNLKLPNTNYVLKRLVDNWKDDNPEYIQNLTHMSSAARFARTSTQELEVFEGSLSPRLISSTRQSVVNNDVQPASPRFEPHEAFGDKPSSLGAVGDGVSHAFLEGMFRQLRSAVDTLFRTENLAQCERAVLVAVHVWEESKCDPAVAGSLSRAGVVEGMMEVLSNSEKDEILRCIVCLLSDLISRNEFTRHTVLRVDPDAESITSVLKNAQVPQVAVLLHLLKVPATQLSALKVVPFLVSVVKNSQSFGERTLSTSINPKAAAVYILEQLVTTLDHRTNMANAEAIVNAEGVPSLMDRLETNVLEEKISAVAVLWSCLQSNGGCRMLMVQNLKMSTLVDLLHNSKEQARTVAIFFLAELVRLNRRRVIKKVLKDVLQEGLLNSMHVLMLHLQMSPLEHRPLVASLLLQLDLLAEPQKHSVYRDEAVEALVESLTSEYNPKIRLEAAKALASLSGRYSFTGKPVTEASLLKYAGLDAEFMYSDKFDYGQSSTETRQSWEDEQMAAENWDQKMTVALLGSGRSLIEALGGALSSKSPKLMRPCVVATAWLTKSLRQVADSNLLSYARNCLLPSLAAILQTGRDVEGRVLACLSLYSLTNDAVGAQQLIILLKDLVGPLRRLRRHTWTAKCLLGTLITSPSVDLSIDMWAHGEVGHLDATHSGETRAILYSKGYIYSGHADASIKVWVVRRRIPRMVQEVREHTRTVLCLTVLEEEQKMFSGSADKTVRIWLLKDERMRCLQVINVEEAVHSVAVNSSFICVVPQGVGLKVLDAEGENPRLLNAQKHVQSVTFGERHVYCGCTDNSIQEIDPATGTSVTFQLGTRSVKGKKAIYSMQMLDSQLFAGGMTVEGIAVKIWRVSTKSLVSSIATQIDVRSMAISEDLIYLASNSPEGTVEVWLRKTYRRVASFNVGSKILSLALVGETLYTGSVDGKLRAWALI